jgi:hypothetical protein
MRSRETREDLATRRFQLVRRSRLHWLGVVAKTVAAVKRMLHQDMDLDPRTRTEIEAAAFRRLVQHLRERPDVQNIDLMNLAGFCRNCLSKWFRAEAQERGVEISDPAAREQIYGMPYDTWKVQHQK